MALTSIGYGDIVHVRFEEYIFCILFPVYPSTSTPFPCWSAMSLTSIGYGDIGPVRLEEYIFCIIFPV